VRLFSSRCCRGEADLFFLFFLPSTFFSSLLRPLPPPPDNDDEQRWSPSRSKGKAEEEEWNKGSVNVFFPMSRRKRRAETASSDPSFGAVDATCAPPLYSITAA
jgi:hypothetical protein